jgi:hypothetical protein
MADNWIKFSTGNLLGQKIKQARNSLKSGRDMLNEVVATLAQMKDSGNVGTLIQEECGCPDLTEAENLVAELESIQFKLNTNDSQSNLDAAFDQYEARFGP